LDAGTGAGGIVSASANNEGVFLQHPLGAALLKRRLSSLSQNSPRSGGILPFVVRLLYHDIEEAIGLLVDMGGHSPEGIWLNKDGTCSVGTEQPGSNLSGGERENGEPTGSLVEDPPVPISALLSRFQCRSMT